MKKFFNVSLIAIVLAFTVGCQSAVKVKHIGPPISKYELGQAPRPVEFEFAGKVWKENAPVLFQDVLNHQRALALEEYAHHERTNRLGILEREQKWAETNITKFRYEVVPQNPPPPTAPPAQTQTQPAPKPTVQMEQPRWEQPSPAVEYEDNGAGFPAIRSGRETAAAAFVQPASYVQPMNAQPGFWRQFFSWKRFHGFGTSNVSTGDGGFERQDVGVAVGPINLGGKVDRFHRKLLQAKTGPGLIDTGGVGGTFIKNVLDVSASVQGVADVNSGLTSW